MNIVGANPNSNFAGGETLTAKTNYFKGNNSNKWQTDVPKFSDVCYENVYEGISLAYYSNAQGEPEYDFIVAPNMDAAKIKLELKGADDVNINKQGDLEIATAAGKFVQHKPTMYQ